MKRTLALTLGLKLLLVGSAIAQTSIVLRPAANVPAGQSVRLSDLADVTGPEAERLREAVVLNDDAAKSADTTRGLGVSIEDVRRALENLPRGVNWGRVTLSGSTCLVRPIVETVEAAPAATPNEPLPGRKMVPVEAASLDGQTARAIVAERLAMLHAVDLADLRVKIVASNRADEAFLDAPVGVDERLEIQPGSGLRSARTPLTVDLYRGDRLKESRVYSTEVQVRREVLIASALIDRDQTVREEDLRTETRWLNPSVEASVAADDVIGASAKKRIEAGRAIAMTDIQPAVVVQRGEQVWVHCLSGQFVVKIKCRAMAAARDGQLVQLQAEGSKKPFTARMSGRGVAVIEMPASDDIEPRDLTIFRATDEQGRPKSTGGTKPRATSGTGRTPVRVTSSGPKAPAPAAAPIASDEPTVRDRSRQARAATKR